MHGEHAKGREADLRGAPSLLSSASCTPVRMPCMAQEPAAKKTALAPTRLPAPASAPAPRFRLPKGSVVKTKWVRPHSMAGGELCCCCSCLHLSAM
jgi:hypothetical protein